MQFLSQYGWIISVIGLCLNILVLFFCRNKNTFTHFEKGVGNLLSNDNVYALLSQLLSKPMGNKELIDNLSQLITYIKGDRK